MLSHCCCENHGADQGLTQRNPQSVSLRPGPSSLELGWLEEAFRDRCDHLSLLGRAEYLEVEFEEFDLMLFVKVVFWIIICLLGWFFWAFAERFCFITGTMLADQIPWPRKLKEVSLALKTQSQRESRLQMMSAMRVHTIHGLLPPTTLELFS